MPQASHAAAPTSAQKPTFAQLRDLLTQIDNGAISRASLQAFLRKQEEKAAALVELTTPPLWLWSLSRGLVPAHKMGYAQPLTDEANDYPQIGFLLATTASTNTFKFIGKYRRPFIGVLDKGKDKWKVEVYGVEHTTLFHELAKEMEKIYNHEVEVALTKKRAQTESFVSDFGE